MVRLYVGKVDARSRGPRHHTRKRGQLNVRYCNLAEEFLDGQSKSRLRLQRDENFVQAFSPFAFNSSLRNINTAYAVIASWHLNHENGGSENRLTDPRKKFVAKARLKEHAACVSILVRACLECRRHDDPGMCEFRYHRHLQHVCALPGPLPPQEHSRAACTKTGGVARRVVVV